MNHESIFFYGIFKCFSILSYTIQFSSVHTLEILGIYTFALFVIINVNNKYVPLEYPKIASVF